MRTTLKRRMQWQDEEKKEVHTTRETHVFMGDLAES